jgi:hypothetical protein
MVLYDQHQPFARLSAMQLSSLPSVCVLEYFLKIRMPNTSQTKEHMDVISSDRKTVGKVDHLERADKKLTKQSSPDGQHDHFIPASWIDHVD